MGSVPGSVRILCGPTDTLTATCLLMCVGAHRLSRRRFEGWDACCFSGTCGCYTGLGSRRGEESVESSPFHTVLRGSDQSRGRCKRGARTQEPWGRGDLPRRPDLLRTACLQLRLLRRGPCFRPPLPRRLRGRALRLYSLSFRILYHHGLPLLPVRLRESGSARRPRTRGGSRPPGQGVLGLRRERARRKGPGRQPRWARSLPHRLPPAARTRGLERAARPSEGRLRPGASGVGERGTVLRVRGYVLGEDAGRFDRYGG